MLWLLHYQPEPAADAGGGSPGTDKPSDNTCKLELVAHGLPQVSGGRGSSSCRANFKMQMHRNSSTEIRRLQKIAGTWTWVFSYLFRKGEEALIRVAKLQPHCTNIDVVGAESGQGQALLSSSMSVPLQTAVTNPKSCFTFANGDILLAPRQQEEESVILDSFYHTRKTS